MEKDEINNFLNKQLNLVTTELTIINALLEDPDLHKPVEIAEFTEFTNRTNKIIDFSERMGYLQGKLDEIKKLLDFINK